MVDYEIDTTSSVNTLDAIASQSYNQLIAELSRDRMLSAYCKSRLVDFTCAAVFQKCPDTKPVRKIHRSGVTISDGGITLKQANAVRSLTKLAPQAAEPLQPCNSFCREVLSVCGGQDPEMCDLFTDKECFTIPPSSKKSCLFDNECPLGEYCFFYATGQGICLVE